MRLRICELLTEKGLRIQDLIHLFKSVYGDRGDLRIIKDLNLWNRRFIAWESAVVRSNYRKQPPLITIILLLEFFSVTMRELIEFIPEEDNDRIMQK